MSKLWRWSLILGTGFMVICLGVMFWYSANKSLVIIEEQDMAGEADLTELTETILQQKDQYDFIVIVNPAHGGTNLGNVVNDMQEKEITLAVGLKLEELGQEGDIGIFVIRTADIDISNDSRVELIKTVNPDMVLDLHANADPDNERTLGTSVLYNADFYHTKMTNVELADLLERELVTAISGKANGVFSDEEGKYPLLRMIQVPGVSVEMGYLTNSEEAALLKREDYQLKLAQGLYRGIVKAREEMTES